jgi:hypothetical protein
MDIDRHPESNNGSSLVQDINVLTDEGEDGNDDRFGKKYIDSDSDSSTDSISSDKKRKRKAPNANTVRAKKRAKVHVKMDFDIKYKKKLKKLKKDINSNAIPLNDDRPELDSTSAYHRKTGVLDLFPSRFRNPTVGVPPELDYPLREDGMIWKEKEKRAYNRDEIPFGRKYIGDYIYRIEALQQDEDYNFFNILSGCLNIPDIYDILDTAKITKIASLQAAQINRQQVDIKRKLVNYKQKQIQKTNLESTLEKIENEESQLYQYLMLLDRWYNSFKKTEEFLLPTCHFLTLNQLINEHPSETNLPIDPLRPEELLKNKTKSIRTLFTLLKLNSIRIRLGDDDDMYLKERFVSWTYGTIAGLDRLTEYTLSIIHFMAHSITERGDFIERDPLSKSGPDDRALENYKKLVNKNLHSSNTRKDISYSKRNLNGILDKIKKYTDHTKTNAILTFIRDVLATFINAQYGPQRDVLRNLFDFVVGYYANICTTPTDPLYVKIIENSIYFTEITRITKNYDYWTRRMTKIAEWQEVEQPFRDSLNDSEKGFFLILSEFIWKWISTTIYIHDTTPVISDIRTTLTERITVFYGNIKKTLITPLQDAIREASVRMPRSTLNAIMWALGFQYPFVDIIYVYPEISNTLEYTRNDDKVATSKIPSSESGIQKKKGKSNDEALVDYASRINSKFNPATHSNESVVQEKKGKNSDDSLREYGSKITSSISTLRRSEPKTPSKESVVRRNNDNTKWHTDTSVESWPLRGFKRAVSPPPDEADDEGKVTSKYGRKPKKHSIIQTPNQIASLAIKLAEKSVKVANKKETQTVKEFVQKSISDPNNLYNLAKKYAKSPYLFGTEIYPGQLSIHMIDEEIGRPFLDVAGVVDQIDNNLSNTINFLGDWKGDYNRAIVYYMRKNGAQPGDGGKYTVNIKQTCEKYIMTAYCHFFMLIPLIHIEKDRILDKHLKVEALKQKATKLLSSVEDSLSKIIKEEVEDDSKHTKMKRDYSPSIEWALDPLNSGVGVLRPTIKACIEISYSAIKQYIKLKNGVTLHMLMRDPDLMTTFAQLCAIKYSKQTLINQRKWESPKKPLFILPSLRNAMESMRKALQEKGLAEKNMFSNSLLL